MVIASAMPPSRVTLAINVVFLARFLGTSPYYALSPLGARALKRLIEVWNPLSSTNTSRLTSKRFASHPQSPLAPSSRSLATRDFF
jgi:hypothetical protein